MITRRTFLQAIGCGAASFVVPGQRRNIDLMEFCGEDAMHDYSLPHQVGEWTFATDARMAVRVRPILADAFHHKSDRVPPFARLPWDKSKLIWRPIPKLEPIVAADSPCPKCDGTGYWPTPPESALVACDCYGEGCRDCDDRGDFAPGYECSMCCGKGLGKLPAMVKLDDAYVYVKYFRKFEKLGGEYAINPWSFPYQPAMRDRQVSLVRFRFADGDGMMMPIDPDSAVARIEAAR